MKTKLQRQEALVEAIEREWKRVIDFYKNQGISESQTNKKSSGLANKPGLDRMHLRFEKDQITIQDTWESIDHLFITGNSFKLTTGIHFKHWYSKLEVNLPKAVYGNNIRNIRKKEDLLKAIALIEEDLEEHGISIDILSGKKTYLEINKNMELKKEFPYYRESSKIMLDDREPIINKKFTPNSTHENPYTGWKAGKENKKAAFYDKCYEQVRNVFKDNEYFNKLPKKELRKLSKKFITLARLEFQVSKEPLNLLLKRILLKEEVTLGDLSENLESNLDRIYDRLLEEIGFDKESYKKAEEVKRKRLISLFKQFIRMYPNNFISALLKYRPSYIWGISQGVEVFREIGGSGSVPYKRGEYFKKEFLKIRDTSNRIPDYIEDIKELIEKFN